MNAKILLLALLVVPATALLYGKTQTVDLERHEETRQALGDLSESSARLSEDVLRLRCALLTNYDSVANAQRRFGATLDHLKSLYEAGTSPEERAVVAGIDACKEALTLKGELAEEFKSRSAVLENSLDYLPILGDAIIASAAEGGELPRLLDDLLRDVLVYNRNARKGVAARVRASITRLGDLRASLNAETLRKVDFLIAHVENVLRSKPAVDALLSRIASVPVSIRIERLRDTAESEYDRGARSAAWYRRALLVVSALLVLAVALSLVKHQQKTLALTAANRELERSVLEVARKEAETRAILEGAADAILSIDERGTVLSVNPAAERLFGYRDGSAVGKPFVSLVSSPWEPLKGRLGQTQEALGTTRDGSFVSVEIILSGVDIGDRKVYIAILQDITERKRVERLKDEFVSTVSHELRTPLTSIRGSLGLVAHGVAGALPPKAKGMLDIAVKNTDRLVGLVNDILDMEKITSGKIALKMRAVELVPLLAQAVEVNRPYAEICGVSLRLRAPERSPVAFGDPDRLLQVLTNLISNACKFSPRGEAVTLGVATTPRKVRVLVSDRGPGIPEEFRSRIFQKFAQAASGDASGKKGTGLGLAISRAFVEKMGGTIGFTSEAGQGTTFFFELEERKDADAPAARAERPKVLVCEDEPGVVDVLRKMLDRDGFDSDVAVTVGEARRLLATEGYAALTLNLGLPDGHSVAFLKEVRECPRTADLPVIVVSARLEEDRRRLGGQAFAILDWIEKPLRPDRLSRALSRAVTNRPGIRARILHVEDDPDVCQVVRGLLGETATVDHAGTVMDAWEKLKAEDYDLLLLDVGLPDGSGLELLPALQKSTSKPIPSLVFSAHELSPRTAKYVSAALLKSTTSNDELVRRIQSLLPDPGRVPPSLQPSMASS